MAYTDFKELDLVYMPSKICSPRLPHRPLAFLIGPMVIKPLPMLPPAKRDTCACVLVGCTLRVAG